MLCRKESDEIPEVNKEALDSQVIFANIRPRLLQRQAVEPSSPLQCLRTGATCRSRLKSVIRTNFIFVPLFVTHVPEAGPRRCQPVSGHNFRLARDTPRIHFAHARLSLT